jgi:hypothetical protein
MKSLVDLAAATLREIVTIVTDIGKRALLGTTTKASKRSPQACEVSGRQKRDG